MSQNIQNAQENKLFNTTRVGLREQWVLCKTASNPVHVSKVSMETVSLSKRGREKHQISNQANVTEKHTNYQNIDAFKECSKSFQFKSIIVLGFKKKHHVIRMKAQETRINIKTTMPYFYPIFMH